MRDNSPQAPASGSRRLRTNLERARTLAAPQDENPTPAAPQAPTPRPPAALAISEPRRFAYWLKTGPLAAWLASAVVHASMLIVLSLLIIAGPGKHTLWLTGGDDAGAPLEEMTLDELPRDDIRVSAESGAASLGSVVEGDEISLPGPIASTVGNVLTGSANSGALNPDAAAPSAFDPVDAAGEFDRGDFATELAVLTNPLSTRGGGLEGRKFENRLEAALAGGGLRESERAVELGLAWLAEHQFEDGGWQFDLEQHPSCAGYCRDSGSYASTTSATGLALLCFLGAGYTHQEGKYVEVVGKGLDYLKSHMEMTTHGGDLRDNGGDMGFGFTRGLNRRRSNDDTMYSHGIATVALTEAYAMTHDSALREPAEAAIKFIINAQYDDGGWRYNTAWETRGPGDMTVTGWQLAALKSGLLAGIDVPYDVWRRASDFLDRLEIDDGARFTYVAGERATAATTAIGVLCRMIGGAPRDSRPLLRGTARIGDQRPQQNNVYFIYYASQVLHHLGGRWWEKWNPQMREYLIESQATEGHELGSWYFEEQHSSSGGRLYTTAMAVMTLEVYYRYMPLYGESFVGQAP